LDEHNPPPVAHISDALTARDVWTILLLATYANRTWANSAGLFFAPLPHGRFRAPRAPARRRPLPYTGSHPRARCETPPTPRRARWPHRQASRLRLRSGSRNGLRDLYCGDKSPMVGAGNGDRVQGRRSATTREYVIDRE